MTSALTTLQQWLLFSGALLVVGCVAWRVRVAPTAARSIGGDGSTSVTSSERRVASLALTAIGALTVAWALRLVVQVMAFRDPFVPLMEDVNFLLFQIEWGTVWMVQGGVIAALGVALLVARSRTPPGADSAAELSGPGAAWIAALLLCVGLAATMALSGHASGVAEGRNVALTADALHTLAAGAWIGSLFVILTAGRGSPTALGAQIQAFSPMALISVGTLVSMGAYLSWQHLTAVSDLWTETYGRVLSGKLAVVAVIFGLGFWNWRKGVAVSDTEEGAAIVRRRATWEVAVAVGVVFLTAILTHSPKP